jgi:transcriptional regulator with XRE-family HTH domain
MSPISLPDLGAYLREQRQSARLSLRQLSELAGVSNPYLSQIERGLKKPSAEILQQLAHGLQVSAESLYVRAGILDEQHGSPDDRPGVPEAIAADPLLSARQRSVLLDVYESFVGERGAAGSATTRASPRPSTGSASTGSASTGSASTDSAATRAPSTRKSRQPTRTTS